MPIAPVPATAAKGAVNAKAAGIARGPSVVDLPIGEAAAESAVAAFIQSCPGLVRRTDSSGLTQSGDWRDACAAATSVRAGGFRNFLAHRFEAVQIGDGKAFATGYYEPEIAASRTRNAGFDVPIYGRPKDLIDVNLGSFSDSLKGRKIRGRVDGTAFVPYYERAQIESGALNSRAPILAWAADPVEFFFLQVQGSGRLRLPDGSIMRIGYDTQNGRDYTGIGALMSARGLLGPGERSMQGIVAWLHTHPAEGRRIMDENKSFVFFREIGTPPVGAMGVVVTPQVTVAADPKFVPLGAPVLLSMDRQDASHLWVAQDTGGAIKGANRFDTFWGAGPYARTTAGGMAAHGTAFVLLPIGSIARLGAGGSGDGSSALP